VQQKELKKMKMNQLAMLCCAVVPLAIGCGGVGDDTTTVATADLSMPVFKVVSGAYTPSNITKVGTDACMLALDTAGNFPTIQVTNDGNGHLSLGTNNRPEYSDPAVYSNGTGTFSDSYHVTTSMAVDVNATGCMYHLVRSNVVTVTANNTLSIQFMNAETNFSGTCAAGVSTDCTSAFNYTASMP
jgi:hypothetical protein